MIYSEENRYRDLCLRTTNAIKGSKGVIVASDLSQEWLLPWWWSRYKKFNEFPVTFIDLGLSSEMKLWCKQRGEYILLPVAGMFVSEKEEISKNLALTFERETGKEFWNSRRAWFLKPLCCLHSPYESSIWIDLDCEIKSSITELFSFCHHPSKFSVAKENHATTQSIFNSGVIAFQKTSPILSKWALKSLEDHDKYRGDQDVLNALFQEEKIEHGIIPSIYNWSRLEKENEECKILHWHGPHGKSVIQYQIQKEKVPF